MIIYKCDICQSEVQDRNNMIRLHAWDNNKKATKLGDKTKKKHDICLKCYNKIFGVKE